MRQRDNDNYVNPLPEESQNGRYRNNRRGYDKNEPKQNLQNGTAQHAQGISQGSDRCLVKWLPVPATKHRDEVGTLFHEPHINSSYRSPGFPWYYYMFSILQLHNETINVWTHIVAVGLTLYKLVSMTETIDFISDPYSWPLLAHVICIMLCYTLSSTGHCMHSISELGHFAFFMGDYVGVGLHILGSSIGHQAYSSTQGFYNFTQSFYLPMAFVLSVLGCIGNSFSLYAYKFCKNNPKAKRYIQVAAMSSGCICLVLPVLHRLLVCFFYRTECVAATNTNIVQLIWFTGGTIFFASFFPECTIPGRVDIFFSSHQWFHVFLLLCSLAQVDGIYIDFMNRPEIRTTRSQPTLASVFGPVLLAVFGQLLIVGIFTFKVRQRLAKRC